MEQRASGTEAPGSRSPARTGLHWLLLACAVAAPLALAALSLATPDPRGYGTHESFFMPSCLPMALLGVPCPGCGITTSVTHAMDGDFARALAVQPFGLLLVVLTALLAPAALLLVATGRDLGLLLRRIQRPWWWLLVAALAASWLYKLAIVLA